MKAAQDGKIALTLKTDYGNIFVCCLYLRATSQQEDRY
jgi:hypothetical protein